MAEATALRSNALEYPIYGEPWTVVFPMLDADGDLVTGATTPDAEVSKNGDTFADCTNESTEIATSSGMYYLTLTSTEMTADIVAVIAKSATSGMKTTPIVLYPRKLPQIRTGTCAGGDTAYVTLDASAAAIDDFYNGCVVSCVIDSVREVRVITDYTGSNQRAAVTPAWNTAPDSDDTFIVYATDMRSFLDADIVRWNGTAVATPGTAGVPAVDVVRISNDATAADNCELMFDGTGYAGGTTKLEVKTDSLGTTAKSDVNAEVVDALNTDTYTEPGQEAPGVNVSLVKKIGYLYKAFRNKIEQTATETKLYNDDGSTVGQKSTVSDDGTTYTRGEFGTGA